VFNRGHQFTCDVQQNRRVISIPRRTHIRSEYKYLTCSNRHPQLCETLRERAKAERPRRFCTYGFHSHTTPGEVERLQAFTEEMRMHVRRHGTLSDQMQIMQVLCERAVW
jgi:hypothetical protein